MNKLIEVLAVQSHSRHDALMREYLINECTADGVEVFDDGINIYVTKGVAPYPCVIAHMDTVHHIAEDLTPIVLNGKITGMNATTMTQTGIGGDDKVGIYVALQMLRQYDNIKLFFPSDEEIGCVGSSQVDKKFFDNVTFALQCDRRGNTDFVTDASGVVLSSKAFQKAVLPILTQFGYKFSHGAMTDVMELKEQGIGVSMANMSCGYYNPHSDNEYVDIKDVENVTNMVSEIIKQLGAKYYPHTAPQRPKWNDNESHWWEDKVNQAKSTTRSWANLLDAVPQNPAPSIHSLDDWCQDCMMKPATGNHGLCDDCFAWQREQTDIFRRNKRVLDAMNSVHNKLDLAPMPIVRTTQDIQAVMRQLDKKRKGKKRF